MSTPARDALDDKVNQVFAGKCVRKDLVRAVKVGANVPDFVLEYLLGKYCASSDPAAIELGRRVGEAEIAGGLMDTPSKVESLMGPELRRKDREEVWVLLLNTKLRL